MVRKLLLALLILLFMLIFTSCTKSVNYYKIYIDDVYQGTSLETKRIGKYTCILAEREIEFYACYDKSKYKIDIKPVYN